MCQSYKGPSVNIKLLNIFKDDQIVATLKATAVDYDEWALPHALCIRFYSSHGNC